MIELGSNIVATRAKKPYFVRTRLQELVPRTEISWPSHHENLNYMARGLIRCNHRLHQWHPLHLFLSSGEERTTTQSTIARNIIGRESLRKMVLSFPKYFLFIDAEAESSWIQNFTSTETVLNPRFFSMSSQSDFDSILSHDLLHYEFKIWVINYLDVFTSFQKGPKVLKKYWPRSFRLQAISQLFELGHTHSTSLFPLEIGRKRK